MLLSGMMVFLLTILALFALNTNKAIYNRIVAQNAADAAAETAALWQARGCNLLQHLNNIHYDVNKTLMWAETGAGIACGVAIFAAPAAEAARAAGWTGIGALAAAALEGAAWVSCNACALAPYLDQAQAIFYKVIKPLKAVVVTIFPALEFLYANEIAGQAGADDLIKDVLPSYSGGILKVFGTPIHGESDENSLLQELSAGLHSLPGHVYAFPLDPSALLLQATRKQGKNPPWNWDANWVGSAYWGGSTACTKSPPLFLTPFAAGTLDPGENTWGWADEYYSGHPGFMTWIAGKKAQPELAGLGFLRWLNGGSRASEVPYAFINQSGLPMYAHDVREGDSSKWLKIPGFVAIASSQVEGTPVVPHCDNGKVDSRARLIPVYFQHLPDNWFSGTNYFLYH
jgi:hypothetical protein